MLERVMQQIQKSLKMEPKRDPEIPKISPQMFRTKIVHTSGSFFEIFRKNIEKKF